MTTRLEDLDTLTLEGKRADLWPVIAGSKTSATRKRWAEALDKRIKAELDRRDRADLKAKYPSLKARRTPEARAAFAEVDARYETALVALDATEGEAA